MTERPTLRIAHFIDTQNKGGAEVTLMDLCIYQKQAGHDVIVFHHNNDYITKSCVHHQIGQVDIPAYRFYKSTYTLPLYAFSCAKILKQLNIDVLHSHLFGPITGNALATKLTGCKHIGTLHDIYMIEDKPARAKLLQLTSKLQTKLVCVSNNMADFYIKHMKSAPEKILTIYNAARIPESPSAEAEHKLMTHYQIAENDLIITAVGRLVPLKRVDRIIHSLNTIDRADVKLVIIGDGPEASSLRALVTSLNLDGQVIFTGEISNVSDLLYLSHIFTQFSSTEGLSVSIIEAMACKLPCVVSDVGGNAELIVEGQTGYVIDSERDDLLVNRLHRLLEDEELRSQFGTRAFSHFNDHFTFDKFQHAYLDLYRANN
ncbi:MAG: glycosyltransferase family 4 protein [Gammaproteobacteria bacterium]|nr:glycosyltransferase family 4 protein [Gammaproteobacteria bacterium]